MRTKRVNRYYCDFCKKSGCSAGHMRRHEERCTMNPNRKCGVCSLREECDPDTAALVALLPPLASITPEPQTNAYEASLAKTMPKLREAADGCPGCILAALKQTGWREWSYGVFDYEAEMKPIFDEVNEQRWQGISAG